MCAISMWPKRVSCSRKFHDIALSIPRLTLYHIPVAHTIALTRYIRISNSRWSSHTGYTAVPNRTEYRKKDTTNKDTKIAVIYDGVYNKAHTMEIKMSKGTAELSN